MEFLFDLWAYDDVVENVAEILEQLEAGTMPCDDTWPAEHVALVRRWIVEGQAASQRRAAQDTPAVSAAREGTALHDMRASRSSGSALAKAMIDRSKHNTSGSRMSLRLAEISSGAGSTRSLCRRHYGQSILP